MGFKTDIEIAQECTMEPITAIAEKAGIEEKYLDQGESLAMDAYPLFLRKSLSRKEGYF